MISVDRLQEAKPATLEVDPSVLQDMITRAVAFVSRQTGRTFGTAEVVTEYLSGNGSRVLRLPEPVLETDSDTGLVSVTERPYPGGTETVISLSEVDLRGGGLTHNLVRLGGDVWCQGYEYAVEYQRGYLVDAGPKDVEELVIELVALRLARQGREGLSGETIGGYSYTVAPTHAYDDGDLKSIPGAMRTIRAWQRLVVA